MANPEFHGSVPHRRCETCEHWMRVLPAAFVGGCHNEDNLENLYPQPKRVVAFTTDLAVCSGWKPKG